MSWLSQSGDNIKMNWHTNLSEYTYNSMVIRDILIQSKSVVWDSIKVYFIGWSWRKQNIMHRLHQKGVL